MTASRPRTALAAAFSLLAGDVAEVGGRRVTLRVRVEEASGA